MSIVVKPPDRRRLLNNLRWQTVQLLSSFSRANQQMTSKDYAKVCEMMVIGEAGARRLARRLTEVLDSLERAENAPHE